MNWLLRINIFVYYFPLWLPSKKWKEIYTMFCSTVLQATLIRHKSLCTVTSGNRGMMSSIVWSRVWPRNWLITSHGPDVIIHDVPITLPSLQSPPDPHVGHYHLSILFIWNFAFANCLPSIAGNCWFSEKMAFRLIRERREKRRVAKLDEIFQVTANK